MRRERHRLALHGLGWAAGLLLLVFTLACVPERQPHEALIVASHDAALIDGQVHLTVRVNEACLADAAALGLTATSMGSAIVILPDDPTQGGGSFGASGSGSLLRGSVGLAGLSDACDAEGICEVGLTVIVEAVDGGVAASEVTLTVEAATATHGHFTASALLELEVDGEAAEAAELETR